MAPVRQVPFRVAGFCGRVVPVRVRPVPFRAIRETARLARFRFARFFNSFCNGRWGPQAIATATGKVTDNTETQSFAFLYELNIAADWGLALESPSDFFRRASHRDWLAWFGRDWVSMA